MYMYICLISIFATNHRIHLVTNQLCLFREVRGFLFGVYFIDKKVLDDPICSVLPICSMHSPLKLGLH